MCEPTMLQHSLMHTNNGKDPHRAIGVGQTYDRKLS